MNILRRTYDHLQLKIRANATLEALEALSERQLADLGLAETDLARLARLAAEPSSTGLSLERLATLVRESDDIGASGLTRLRRRLSGAASEARQTAIVRGEVPHGFSHGQAKTA